MLLKKVFSGLVISAAIIASILLFKPVWLCMVLALSLIGTWELARMLQQKGHRVSLIWPGLLNLLLIVGTYLLVDSDISSTVKDWNVGHAPVLAWVNMYMLFASLTLVTRTLFLKPRASMLELSVPFFQMAWLGWFPCFFILIRAIPSGEYFLVWALTTTAFSDIGAYFSGKFLGKHPYFQHLSPNKTMEGSLGGVVASMLIGLLLAYSFRLWMHIPWYHVLILSAGLACLGQVGDLIESMVKRAMEVKDSGSWLPGFGGLLDRIDAYLFLAPFLYFYLINFVLGAV